MKKLEEVEKELIVKKLECDEKKKNNLKITFSCDFGEYSLSIPKQADGLGANDRFYTFWPGDKFYGKLKLTAYPDFIGDNVKEMKIATMSYELIELKDRYKNLVYRTKRKDKKDKEDEN